MIYDDNMPTLKSLCDFRNSLKDLKPSVPHSKFKLGRFYCVAKHTDPSSQDGVDHLCGFIDLKTSGFRKMLEHVTNVRSLMLTNVKICSQNTELILNISRNWDVTIVSCNLKSDELTEVLDIFRDVFSG